MPGNRRPRQMVTVPQGIQNPAYRRSRPTFCIPKTASWGRHIAVAASDLAAARRLGGVDTTFRGNSKSLANLLCALRGACRCTGQDREGPGSNPGPPTKFLLSELATK